MTGIIILILLGILLFLIEFLLVPGATIAGIGGLILMGSGVYLAFEIETKVGLFVLLFALVFSVLILVLALRSRTWRGAMLNTKIEGKVNEGPEAGKVNVGDLGHSLTRLAPIGKIKVNDITMEGKSSEGYINPNTEIEILKITGAQAIVKPKK